MNGTYDPALVIASYGVAATASYAALNLGGRIAALACARFWLLGGALVLGTAIWAMHMVGMTALKLSIRVSYNLPLTVLSWLCACGVSMLALNIIGRNRLGAAELVGGALAMGGGLCLMHYSGLWAMRMMPHIVFDPELVMASTAIAVLASAAMLFVCFRARQLSLPHALPLRIAAALLSGVILCTVHYSGMSAAHFAPGALCAAGNLISGNWTGLPLALISMGLLGAVLLLSRMDTLAVQERGRVQQQRFEIERVRQLAYYDAATALPNRSLFNEILLRQLINVNGNPPRPFGVVYAELRGYRALVEKLGQDRVSLVLKSLTGALLQSLRESDVLARLSHDSFVCLVRDHADRSIAAGTAQFSARFNAPVQCESQSLRLVWGIGASRYPDNGNSTQALIRAAMKLQYEVGDEAMVTRQEIVSALGAA